MKQLFSTLVPKGRLLIVLLVSWLLLCTTMPTMRPEGSNVQQMRRRLVPRDLQTTTQAYNVTIFLSLQYLNQEIASQLEQGDDNNTVVLTFCGAVNIQASGNQVKIAAEPYNAVFETKTQSNDPIYECSILDTNRIYDSEALDLFGPDFFALEVAVSQIVYVTTTGALLSLAEVTQVVTTGFNRGTGGRVKFRTLLVQNGTFSTVINVEVLNGMLSPPQAPPTYTPSQAPTKIPSTTPSISPSSDPTLSPSHHPSSTPTMHTTDPPSLRPSLLPTMSPSLQTRFTPISNPESNSRPFVYGAIAGGITTILVSCFFVLCVWFPFCGKRDNEHPDNGLNEVQEQGPQQLYIPGMVSLDDGNESLANTTLGEHTTGGAFRHGVPPKKKQMMEPMSFGPMDSFDESSLYTSNISIIASTTFDRRNGTDFAQHSDQVLNARDGNDFSGLSCFEGFAVIPSINRNSNKPQKELEAISRSSSNPVDVDFVSLDDSLQNESKSDEDSFCFVDAAESDEEMARQVSQNIDKGTKGYDPFEDQSSASSSFGFDKFERDMRAFDNANISTLENLILGTAQIVDERNSLIELKEGEAKREIDTEIRDDVEGDVDGLSDSNYQFTDIGGTTELAVRNDEIPEKTATNNALLRSILEDARRLAERKSSSNRSRLSRKSAPPRSLQTSSANFDLLADLQDFEESRSLASLRGHQHLGDESAQGETPAKGGSDKVFPRSEEYNVSTASQNDRPSRSRPLERHELKQALHVAVEMSDLKPRAGANKTMQRTSAIQSKSPTESTHNQRDLLKLPLTLSPETLGAKPMDRTFSHPMGEPCETPASSPGVLGIVRNENDSELLSAPSSDIESASSTWLFDKVEKTLGPRSPNADMESISGRSARSLKSNKSAHSGRHETRKGRLSSDSKQTCLPKRPLMSDVDRPVDNTRASIGNDEQKTAFDDSDIFPRSLEQDLKRLEIRLAGITHSTDDQLTASSITASSFGGSTLSSKHRSVLKRSKKDQLVVVVPPGKVGIVLSNRNDGKGTIVSEVRSFCSVKGILSPGDKIVAVDDQDVTGMVVGDITSLMASRSERERRLTIISSTALKYYNQVDSSEAKIEK